MPKKPTYTNDVTFVNYNLTTEEKQAIKSQKFTLDDFDSTCVKLTESDYKITFSFDKRGSCYQAFLIPQRDGMVNKGLILAGRGSTPVKALKQAAYIHYRIFDEDWSQYQRAGSLEIDD